jgi:hypothetical protein
VFLLLFISVLLLLHFLYVKFRATYKLSFYKPYIYLYSIELQAYFPYIEKQSSSPSIDSIVDNIDQMVESHCAGFHPTA